MSDSSPPPDTTLLARYLSGECTPDELAEVDRWLQAGPAHAAELAVLAAAWNRPRESAAAGPALDVDRFWLRLRRRIEPPVRPSLRVLRSPSFSIRRASPWVTAARVAASVVLLAGAGLALRMLLTRAPAPAPAPEYSVISTTRGQRLAVRLADNTSVMLAPGTTLRTPSDYGRRERALELDGEAAFTVTHDSTRPFSVRTSRAVARDLGTRFVVRSYATDAVTDVVVAEGLVAVDSLVIAAAQRVRVDREGRLALTSGVSLERYFGWTEGRLVFRRTPLQEAVAQLSRWYDLEIELASPALGARVLTATFSERESVPQVLQVITTALGLEIVELGARSYRLQARS